MIRVGTWCAENDRADASAADSAIQQAKQQTSLQDAAASVAAANADAKDLDKLATTADERQYFLTFSQFYDNSCYRRPLRSMAAPILWWVCYGVCMCV